MGGSLISGHDDPFRVFFRLFILVYHMHRKSAILSSQVCCLMRNVCSLTYRFQIWGPADQMKLLTDNLRC